MVLQSLLAVGFLTTFASLAAAGGACSATTIFYNSAADLQVSIASIASTYAICNTTATTSTTSATPTNTCALTANAPCFYIVGHGEPHIEGKMLGWEQGEGSPQFNYPASIFYIDTAGHLTVANTFNPPYVTMTYYIGTESWWGISTADAPTKYGTDYQPSQCTAHADGSLECYQYGGINSNVMNVWTPSFADNRAYYLPHWGPLSPSAPLTLTWQQTACPALC